MRHGRHVAAAARAHVAGWPSQPAATFASLVWGQLRVHWDRVAILAAILILIVVLIVVLIVRAFTGAGRQGETAPATDPLAATTPAIRSNTTPAGPIPTVAEAWPVPSAESSSAPSTVAKPCPAPAVKPSYAAPPLSGGDPSMRTVALTFDDGPAEFTSQVLDILREKQVRATFFVVGEMVAQRPDVLRAIVDSGHLIGNHTWSHRTPPHRRAGKRRR